MKTPAFWSEPNFLSRLLKPLGAAYAFATRLRIGLGRPCKIGRPVVCIGNLTAGGTGKTPVAVAIAGLLQQAGKNPFFVSRGYGGTLKNIMVDKEKHTASEVGDEPLLLARRAPVIVNPDRVAGAQKALRSGAEVIVMDDGKIALDGTPKEVFTQVEPLRDMGLTVPDTVDLLDRLRKDGLEVPLDALTVEECAAAITAALTKN